MKKNKDKDSKNKLFNHLIDDDRKKEKLRKVLKRLSLSIDSYNYLLKKDKYI